MAREVNLAAVLTSGQQIYVPAITERSLLSEQTESDKVAANDSNSSININTASASELETLPGVGPATAEKIIAGRPYDNINDITSVSGIGDATLAKIKDLITL
jgi:competence protein ComEA